MPFKESLVRESAPLPRKCTGEMVGTFILVFFGVGSVHAAVLTGAQQGLWKVAIVSSREGMY